MEFFSKLFRRKLPSVGPDGKIGCKKCGARVLPTTAEKTRGKCMPCFNGVKVNRSYKETVSTFKEAAATLKAKRAIRYHSASVTESGQQTATGPEFEKAEIDAVALATVSGIGDVRTAQTLISEGADINAVGSHGFSALMSASMNGQSEMVEWLVDHGADVNIRNPEGVTPLMLAAHGGHADTIRRLCARGAAVHLQDREGTTAYAFAEGNGHSHCLEFLKV